MNSVVITGRLTRDGEYMETQHGMQVYKCSIAVDREQKKEGGQNADYPRVVVFGKVAESCKTHLSQGSKIAVQGRIKTGSYKDKNGNTVYTTDVVANRIEFMGDKRKPKEEPKDEQVDFAMLDEAVPF